MNDDPYHIRPLPFLLWWVACAVMVWPLAVVALAVVIMPLGILFNILRPIPYNSSFPDGVMVVGFVLLAGLVIAGVVGNLQRWLLRVRLYWAADRWRMWTMTGGLVGAAVVGAGRWLLDRTVSYSVAEDLSLLLAMPVFILFVSLGQWIALRNAVRDAWMWVLANVVAGIVFGGLLTNNQSGGVVILGAAVLTQGIITGFVMLHLFEKKLLPMQPEAEEGKTGDEAAAKSVWDEAI